MAEYITKEQIISILYAPRKAILTFEDFVTSIGNLTPADVIEREKINKAIDEIDFLRQHRAEYITEDSKICIDSGEVLKILKNIGE